MKEPSKWQKSNALQRRFIPQYNAHSPRDLISRVWTEKIQRSSVSETCPCFMKFEDEDEVINCPEECNTINRANVKSLPRLSF